jgi:hypothetical protein
MVMIPKRTPVLVQADWHVRQELKALGLTPQIVAEIARASASAKAQALEVDPLSTPGTLSYIHGVRAIRTQLIPLGWRISRNGNVEATVNDDLAVQLCFQNVDVACAERDPQAISSKGAGSRKLILWGHQGELFERSAVAKTQIRGAAPVVWVVCVSTSDNRLRAEVSCPLVFEGDQFDGFTKRILVLDEELGPHPESTGTRDDDSGDDGVDEIRIVKK